MRVMVPIALVTLLLAAGCRPDTVALSYRFEEGNALHYRLSAEARAEWDIGGRGEGSYRVTFDVTETVEAVEDDEAIVSVVMSPTEVQERGLPSPGSEERSFSLRLGPRGEVLEVLEVQGVAASELLPTQIAFIGTYRPPLPSTPQRLKGTWKVDQRIASGVVSQEIDTAGELTSLERDAEGAKGAIDYRGRGPVVWATQLPQGDADLSGTSRTTIDALFDIDGGFLRKASSSTEAAFDVSVLPTEGAVAITGTLHLDLELDLELEQQSARERETPVV